MKHGLPPSCLVLGPLTPSCKLEQVVERFEFGGAPGGAQIFSGVGDEFKVEDLGDNAGFSYERKLQAFFDRKKAQKTSSNCCIG